LSTAKYPILEILFGREDENIIMLRNFDIFRST